MTFDLPTDGSVQVVEKGSITINGISLTTWDVDKTSCRIAVIPPSATPIATSAPATPSTWNKTTSAAGCSSCCQPDFVPQLGVRPEPGILKSWIECEQCAPGVGVFFTTPLAWLVLAAWALITNLTFGYTRCGCTKPVRRIRYFISLWAGAGALVFLAPALTMNSFASERVHGTEQLLMTVPITEQQLVLGKFIAVMGMFMSLIVVTLCQPLVLYFVGENGGWQLGSGYLGMILVSGLLASLGIWISLLVDSPVAAYVITFGVIVVLYLVGLYANLPRSKPACCMRYRTRLALVRA